MLVVLCIRAWLQSLAPMLQSMAAIILALRMKNKKTTLPWEQYQERSDRIDRRFEPLLVQGCRCFSQAFGHTEPITASKKWLKKIELDKIKTECEDECYDSCAELECEHIRLHCYRAWLAV